MNSLDERALAVARQHQAGSLLPGESETCHVVVSVIAGKRVGWALRERPLSSDQFGPYLDLLGGNRIPPCIRNS